MSEETITDLERECLAADARIDEIVAHLRAAA